MLVIATASSELDVEWESTELQVMKGYLIAVEIKLSQPLNETFCSVPTDDANFCYLNCLTSGALAAQCKPAKMAIRRRWADRLSDD